MPLGIIERKRMGALVSYIFVIIYTTRLLKGVQNDIFRNRRLRELTSSLEKEVNLRSNYESNLQYIYDSILEKGMRLLGVRTGQLFLVHPLGNFLELRSIRGNQTDPIFEQKFGEGIVGYCAKVREAILVPNVKSIKWRELYIAGDFKTRSEMAVPLIDNYRVRGVFKF